MKEGSDDTTVINSERLSFERPIVDEMSVAVGKAGRWETLELMKECSDRIVIITKTELGETLELTKKCSHKSSL